jgi:dephospho-CoA kinase
MHHKETLIVAITGGIGCGQTTVAQFFQKFGAKVINADLIAKNIVDRDPEVKREIQKVFGNRVFFRNGRVNRKLLGQLAFEDESRLRNLNKIVHPRMVSQVIEEIEGARDTGKFPIIVIDAALIYEINLEHTFDAVVVVASPISNRITWIKARDGLSEKEIHDRINRQIPVEDKTKWADFVIHNNSSLEQLEQRAKFVYEKLLQKLKK